MRRDPSRHVVPPRPTPSKSYSSLSVRPPKIHCSALPFFASSSPVRLDALHLAFLASEGPCPACRLSPLASTSCGLATFPSLRRVFWRGSAQSAVRPPRALHHPWCPSHPSPLRALTHQPCAAAAFVFGCSLPKLCLSRCLCVEPPSGPHVSRIQRPRGP